MKFKKRRHLETKIGILLLVFTCLISFEIEAGSRRGFELPKTCRHPAAGVKACDIHTFPEHIDGRVTLKVYGPSTIEWSDLPVVVFLHGRSGGSTTGKEAQVFKFGIPEYFSTKDYKDFPFIVVAPQDHFDHNPSPSKVNRGNDYWMSPQGTDRDWEMFLHEELPEIVADKISPTVETCKPVIAGISMGAHGAISMAEKFPSDFTAAGVHSPVFRVFQTDVHESDEDVFNVSTDAYAKMEKSFGTRFMLNQADLPLPSFIDIGEEDYFLTKKYQNGQMVWSKLIQEQETLPKHSIVRMGSAPNGSNAHKTAYWKSMGINYYFPWYQQQFENHCQ